MQKDCQARILHPLSLVLVVLSLLFIAEKSAAADKFILWDQNYNQGYSYELIQLVADATVADFGPYLIEKSIHLEQGRAIAELEIGRSLNIAVMGNDRGRESRLEAVYFPVDKGELGLRICMIKQDEQHKFDGLRSAEDARKRDLVFGLGSYWPDTPIYAANGFNVYSSPVFANLFKALKIGRFDCLSRSISEVYGDLQTHGGEELGVEQKIAFVYPLANFIYLKRNSSLRERVLAGIEIIQKNGSFDKLVERHLQEDMTALRFFARKLIILENPELTDNARQAINDYGLISFEQAKEKH